jgi:hypothetical protein
LRQLYINNNYKRRVASVGNKSKWQLFKASCLNGRHIAVIIRQVAVTCRRGISVVRSLKFLTPSFVFLTTINIILSTNRSYVISLCNTNSSFYNIFPTLGSVKSTFFILLSCLIISYTASLQLSPLSFFYSKLFF